MRRQEFNRQNEAFFHEVAAEVKVGYLGLQTTAGHVRSVALNFTNIGLDIYFHGALAGEKYELLSQSPSAGFTIVNEYSYIPSHWSGPHAACPATQYFKSVELVGRCEAETDLTRKAQALQLLMEKYQPEGQHTPIDATQAIYRKALKHVGVFRLRCESWTGKEKFGQNLSANSRRAIIDHLRRRNGPRDEITALEIENHLAADGG